MNRGVGIAVLLAVGIAAAYWIARPGDEAPLPRVRRPGFELPAPAPGEATAHFFDLLVSAETWRIGSASAPVGRSIGRDALIDGGPRTLDWLLSEERYPAYFRAPNRLLVVLDLLEDVPGFREHPRMEPFLRHWLDPDNCPRDTPGMRAAEEFRKAIFHLFRVQPPAWAAPYCVAELTRENRHHDLRLEALGVLLYTGVTEPVREHWDRLPPTEDEAQPLLKPFVLGQMRVQAGASQPQARRDAARDLAPLAHDALERGDLYSRVSAASTLLRLGDDSMADRLLALSQEARDRGDEETAWSALLLLVEDRRDPRVRELCLARVEGPVETDDFTYRTALKVLAYGWIEEAAVRERIWAYVEEMRFGDLSPLQWLSRVPGERDRIVAFLRAGINGDDTGDRIQAVRFATNAANPVPEVMPDLLRVTRETPPDEGRTRYLNALVTMRFDPVMPLLLADLDDELPVLRRAAAANLLEMDTEASVGAVGQRLEEGDREMLAPIVARAQARGAAGVRERLLPGLLRTLRRARGEDDRFWALFALRCRGLLEGVEEGLMDAYRREPSRRVAEAIRETIVELALRNR